MPWISASLSALLIAQFENLQKGTENYFREVDSQLSDVKANPFSSRSVYEVARGQRIRFYVWLVYLR